MTRSWCGSAWCAMAMLCAGGGLAQPAPAPPPPAKPPADKPPAAKPPPTKPPAAKPPADKPAGDKPPADKPAGDKPAAKPADQPVGDKPAGDKPAAKPADQPPADKPTADEPTADKPPADKPAGDKPSGGPAGKVAGDVSEVPATPQHGSHRGRGDSRGPGKGDGLGRHQHGGVGAPESDRGPSMAPAAEPSLLDKLSFAPHLQYRARYYHVEGRDFVSGNARNFVRHRARAGASATYDGKVGLRLVLQDVRTFGEELDPVSDYSADGFDLQEGYAYFRPAKGVDLRVGRQEVILLNARLIGNLDFAEQARSLDAVRAMYDDDGLEAELLYALVRDFDENAGPPQAGTLPDGKRHMGMVHLGYQVTKWLVPHVVTIVEGDTGRDAVTLTAGALVDGKTGRGVMFDYTAEGYYQWGREAAALPGGPDPRISAFLFAARSRISADYPILPFGEVEVTVISGDDDPSDPTTKVFHAPHPTGHKFNGEADLFINFPVDTRGRGLLDVNAIVGTDGKPVKGRISYHYFDAVESRDAGAFGHEVDFIALWPFWDYASIAATYGFFVPGAYFKALAPDHVIEHVAFITADLKFDEPNP